MMVVKLIVARLGFASLPQQGIPSISFGIPLIERCVQCARNTRSNTMKVKTNIRAGAGGASGAGKNSTGVDTTATGALATGSTNSPAARAAAAAAAQAAYLASPQYQIDLAAAQAAAAAAAAAQAAYYASPAYQAYLASIPVGGRCVGI
jgi:hypothetical protein